MTDTVFYAEMAEVAREILDEFGATASIVRAVQGAYDPETQTQTPASTSTTSCVAAVFPIADKYVDGSLIKTGDEVAYVSAIGLGDPTPGDTFVWNGTRYRVEQGEVLAPGAIAVLYTLRIRKK